MVSFLCTYRSSYKEMLHIYRFFVRRNGTYVCTVSLYVPFLCTYHFFIQRNGTYVTFFVRRNSTISLYKETVPFFRTKKQYVCTVFSYKETVCTYIPFLRTKKWYVLRNSTVSSYEKMVRTYRFFVRRNGIYMPFLRTKKRYILLRMKKWYRFFVQRNGS